MKIIERQLITTTARAISNLAWNDSLLRNTPDENPDIWNYVFERIKGHVESFENTSDQEAEMCRDFFTAFLGDFFLNGGFENDPLELSLLALRALTCCEILKGCHHEFESHLTELLDQWGIEYSIDDLEKLIKYQLPTQH
jgi:hypothetical protein